MVRQWDGEAVGTLPKLICIIHASRTMFFITGQNLKSLTFPLEGQREIEY